MSQLVSIIITCFNQSRFLEKSVGSVLRQTFADLECLIVDDGSTDDTRQVAESLMKLDPRVKYFYKENGGVSSARNFGYRQAMGEWIQFLDGDDWINEDKIRFQLSYRDTVTQTTDVVFYSDYDRVYIDASCRITEQQSRIVGSLDRQQLIQRLVIPDFLIDSPFPVLQQCLLMHRSVLQKKMFDETLKASEDRDFALDLLMAGVNFVYTPIVGAFYSKHTSNSTNNYAHMKRNYILLYETLDRKAPHLMQFCKIGVEYFLDEAIREQEAENFRRLSKMLHFPVTTWNGSLQVNNLLMVKFLYYIRPFVPKWFVHPMYRGPRSEKLRVQLAKLAGWLSPSH
jgi:glycosyltransferase involved in cell wall biosynthesis